MINDPELWAILPRAFERMQAALADRTLVAEPLAAVASASPRATGSVAVLPLMGAISQRLSPFAMFFGGGASTESFGAMLSQAVADPNVSAIVINVDSPGGTVTGVPELASAIQSARGTKPIVAVANGQAASAAYWLASQADELIVTPSGEVGSIGVFCAHIDQSGMLDQMGVKATLISAGKYKTEANPFEPLSDEARAAIQSRVDDMYSMLVGAVAQGRGVAPDDVRSGFGQGRMVGAKQAVNAGMADRVATLDQTVARLASPQARARIGKKAEVEIVEADEPEQVEPVAEEKPVQIGLRRARLRLAKHRHV